MTYFCPLASGSYGNTYLYVNENTRVLVDAGTSAKYIEKALAQFSLTAANLTHILITHGHSDHISALPVLLKRTSACLICPEETLPFLPASAKDAMLFSPGDTFVLHGLPVRTFSTPHDIPGSCGYVLGAGDDAVGLCTRPGAYKSRDFSLAVRRAFGSIGIQSRYRYAEKRAVPAVSAAAHFIPQPGICPIPIAPKRLRLW